MYGSLTEIHSDSTDDKRDDELFQFPSTDMGTRTNVVKSDLILKFFISCLYGIIPHVDLSGEHKDRYFIPAVFVVLSQWFAVAEYSYVVNTYWRSTKYQSYINTKEKSLCNTTCFRNLPSNMMVIPTETIILLMGLVVSGALTVTLGALYFRRTFKANTFSGRRRLCLLPRLGDHVDGDELKSLSKKDWLQINGLLAAGILIVIFSIFTDQFYNTYFDFVGIHCFLHTKFPKTPSELQKYMYFYALSMLFWGYGATICACCLFHAMALRIKAQIYSTEKTVLTSVHSREAFFDHTETLVRYKKEMISMFRLWFVSHNIVFIILLAGIVYEWVEVLQLTEKTIPSECSKNLIMSQLSGTLAIVYKFAFPILSASLVTNRFKSYFKNIAFSNRIKDMSTIEILALAEHSGFEVFYIRVTPKLAILICASCFIGVLKVVAQVQQS